MVTLSLCMIVKDEAVNLPRCLASVKGLADEIVVVDTGSSDETVAIAQTAGAQVTSFLWCDDFAAARNASIQQTSKDWILVLDADETLTSKGRQLIQAIKANQSLGQANPEDLLLVTLLRREIGANQSPYTQVSRLFRNLPQLRFVRPYHESIDQGIEVLMAADAKWKIAHFEEVAIDHTGYSVDDIAAKDKFSRARRIMEAHLAAHPHDAYIANKLGALYTQSNQWNKALDTLQTALRSGNFDPMTLYELHYHLGITHRHLATHQETTPAQSALHLAAAEKHYRTAIAQPLDDRLKLGAQLNLGALFKLKDDLESALAQYEMAVRIDPAQATTYFNLGVIHRARGYLEPALRAYQCAISLDPNYAVAYQNLAVVLFKLGKLPESRRMFEQAIALMEKVDPAEGDRLRQGMKNLGLNDIGR